MRADYHIHTEFSFDSSASLGAQIQSAIDHNLAEICLTDHYEPAYPGLPLWQVDLSARAKALQNPALAPLMEQIMVREGAEIGLLDLSGYGEEIHQLVTENQLDFVIASCHLCQGEDPYYPGFFSGKTRGEAFSLYLTELSHLVEHTISPEDFSVVGHIDFPTKGCPYGDKMLRYTDAPEALDSLFRYLIDHGKGLEINTSIFRAIGKDTLDMAWLKRYRALGGEIVTIGSDAHKPQDVGYGQEAAAELLKEAGFSYLATFTRMEPIFHKIP